MGSSRPAFPPTTGLLPAAAILALLAAASPAGAAGQETITFVAPWPNSLIVEGPVVLAGRLPAGTGEAFFILNGRPLGGAVLRGNTFSVSFTPPRGFNEVEVRARGTSAKITFAFQTRPAGQRPYAYHRPVQEGTCNPCHRQGGGVSSLTEAAACYGCHEARSIMFPFVHGPVAAGTCLVCHDPHGSTVAGLCRTLPGTMCLACHDQPSTAEHTSNRTKVCTICHHPHYATNRRLLRGSF